MTLAFIDWLIIGLYFLFTLGLGMYFTRRAGKNIQNFFLGGRNMTWWLAGVSMVATTFAADTPLAVTELVAQNGIAGNWLWWNALLGGMLTVFFFSKLWRRAEILTDIEFIELRYSGKAAAFLRGFRSIYLGLFMNAVVIGWVNLALASILEVFFDISPEASILLVTLAMVITLIYSSLAGLLGVAVTDFFQFFVAMAGCIVLAIIVVNSEEIGGITGLKEKLPDSTLLFFPTIGEAGIGQTLTLSIATFVSFVAFQWWASWYPGAEPGGGGYIAQRMMSTKNEKHALLSTLFFQIMHYAVRPWPWILVGLSAIVLYPDLPEADKRLGFIMTMKDFLPVGLRGLLLVAFFSAYMSTISTQLNWGASYLVNDFYSRFINPKAEQKKLVNVSRIATVVMMLFSLAVTTQLNSISGAWYFLLQASAGLGLVLILRWYWWRINAWSEIIASIAPIVILATIHILKYFFMTPTSSNEGSMQQFIHWLDQDPNTFFFIIAGTTFSWIIATYTTAPTQADKLYAFYKRIKPLGLWEPIRNKLNMPKPEGSLLLLGVCWLAAIVMTYSLLFMMGKLLFMEWQSFFLYFAISILSAIILIVTASKIKIFED
jgi:SSS family solute:Na+ symporter